MAGRRSQLEVGIRDGGRLAIGRARLDRMVAECDGGVTLHFTGLSCEAAVELRPDDIAEVSGLAARAQAELAAWRAARKGD